MMSDKLMKMFSHRIFRRNILSDLSLYRSFSSRVDSKDTARLFFLDRVQDLLKKLTRVDLDQVYSPRKEGVRFDPPAYKFLTTAEYEKVRKEAEKRAEDKLQMPPVMDERSEIDCVYIKDDNLLGFSKSKFVFTDISYGINDRVRNIVIRDVDGTLRQASWKERDRINQIYFPRPGRKINQSQLFSKDKLQDILDRGEYLFILDLACCQFEPDDPEFIRVCHQTFSAVDSDCAYNTLRSTRHYGPFVFYLAKNKKIDNLLTENIATDRVEDAVWLITLFHILNTDAKSASKPLVKGKELDFIQNYIVKDSHDREKLELTLQTYREYLESPKSELLGKQ